MEIYYPTEEEIEQFRNDSQPVYDQFRDIWGEDHMQTFLDEAMGSGGVE
ncbi:hypothetical protein [Geomicrobium sp. JCM 19055]|nr:hypothetical protein [Geomicrobium sp. JCM 19055]